MYLVFSPGKARTPFTMKKATLLTKSQVPQFYANFYDECWKINKYKLIKKYSKDHLSFPLPTCHFHLQSLKNVIAFMLYLQVSIIFLRRQ